MVIFYDKLKCFFFFYFPNIFQLFEPTECGNGYVEAGEECDCGFHVVGIRDLFYL